jgi:hypothetical protein
MTDTSARPDRRTITVTETIHVDRPPEIVFDYTQEYATRADWDPAVKRARVLSEDPRRVEITSPGLGTYVLEYRLFRRGDRTSAAFSGVDSWLFSGGGGSWWYEPDGDGTAWTQVNTLELRHPRLTGWLASRIEASLRRSMRSAMARAKAIMESRPRDGA